MKNQITLIQKPTVWQTPNLPPKPEACLGVARPLLSLCSADGIDWLFCPQTMTEEQALSHESTAGFTPIQVPGNVLMQGHDIQNDLPYYYKASIPVPADYQDNRILLRFHGVYSVAKVWVNGRLAGEHIGGFTTWDCDITDLVSPGQEASLVVSFMDVLNDVSIASRYAHYNIGGINRDVELLCLPTTHFTRFHYETVFDDAYQDAVLRLFLGTTANSPDAALRFTLLTPQGINVPLETPQLALADLPTDFCLSLPITAPDQWDSEHPHLYTLTAELLVSGQVVESVRRMVGFREITYGGAKGTDLNKIYVNGRSVKLRGTCHHDVHPTLGRTITAAQAEEDVRMIQAANMNYIRTSHYPPTEALLDACDRYGIYVEEENAACFQYTHATPANYQRDDSRWYVAPFAEMVERDRSHPCVLIWSLGNESLWHAKYQEEYDYLKQTDCSRPAKFSYPDKEALDGLTPCYDIFSKHYVAYDGAMSLSSKPTLHDEYVHVPCYDISELINDPNVRAFWGESIDQVWTSIVETDGALGGAVWAGIDDVFPIPAGTHETHQQHSTGSAAGYGEWGNYADIWRREKPEFWMTKKAYSPVRIADHLLPDQVPGKPLTLPVENRFNHTNLSEVRFHWEADGQSGTVQGPDTAPYQKGMLVIPYTGWTNATVLSLRCDTAEFPGQWLDCWSLAVTAEQHPLPVPTTHSLPQLTETTERLTVTIGTLCATISKQTGLLERVTQNETPLLTGGPHFIADGIASGHWQFTALETTLQNAVPSVVVCGLLGSIPMKFTYTFYEHQLEISYAHESDTALCGVQNLGLSLDVPASATKIGWERKGLCSVYPDDHIGRTRSTAERFRQGVQKDAYRAAPNWPWKDDMRNFFLHQKDSEADGLATHDFLALREHIYSYQVWMEGTSLCVHSDGRDSAKMQVFRTLTDKLDDRSSAILYSENDWVALDDIVSFQASLHRTERVGAFAELTFTGDGIRVIGPRSETQGDFEVFIDGVSKGVFSARSSIGSTLVQQAVFSETGLSYGTHTIRICNAGEGLVLDAFEVLDSRRADRETVRLAVFSHWNYPDLSWGNYMRPSITWQPHDPRRIVLSF